MGNNGARWYTPTLRQKKKIKHEKESRSQKEGYKKRSRKGKKKKSILWNQSIAIQTGSFCHIIPSFS